jgi:hypothetical protein
MIYRPRYQRSFSPYGFPPTEWVITRINTALRKQSMDLAHFTDGNIPDMIAAPPEGLLDPNQLREFEQMFNADLSGNDRERSKIKFIPFNMNLRELMPFNYSTEIDRWMMNVTVAAFGVTPSELGFTEDVNRATALAQESITYRRGIESISSWLKSLFDRMLAEDFRSTDLEWQWHFGKADDRMLLAQLDQIYTGMGVISPEEVRALRFGNVLEGPSPAAEAAGVGRNKEQMMGGDTLGVDKLSSSWTTIAKNDVIENSEDENDSSKLKTTSEKQRKSKFFDVLRSSLSDAVDLRFADINALQKSVILSILHENQDKSANFNINLIREAFNLEKEIVSKKIVGFYEDTIRMGYQYGNRQQNSDVRNDDEIVLLSETESQRFAKSLNDKTYDNFADIFANKPYASSQEIIDYIFPDNRLEKFIVPEVNRLFNLGIQLSGKTNNLQKMKWIAHCPVCESRNNLVKHIDSDVLPGLHHTCTCMIELVLEEENGKN